MRVHRTCRMAMAFLVLLLLVGCWDRKEIEDVGIVLGIGFDKPDEGDEDHSHNEGDSTKHERHPFLSTVHHFAIPKQFTAKESGTPTNNYLNITSEGMVVFDNIRELSTRAGRPPSFEHLRIIVISENVARSIDLNKIINFLLRNSETRRSIRVLVSKGKARNVFESGGLEGNPALEMRKMTDHYQTSLSMAPVRKLGEISEKLTGKNSFIIPRIEMSNKIAKVAGAAVIKGKTGKMVGWLDGKEQAGLNLLKGVKKSSGIITGKDPESGETIVFELRSLKSTIKPRVSGDDLSFAVEIKAVGKLREDWVDPGNAFKGDFMDRAVKATEASIRETVDKLLARTQKELKVDIAGFGKQLSIHYPQIWKKRKEDWDNQFSKLKVEISVKVNIQEFGTKGTKKG